MISFESAPPRSTHKLDTPYVVWLADRLGTDEEFAEIFKQGCRTYPLTFAAYVFGTKAADMDPDNLLSTFSKAHVGDFPTETQALEAALGRLGWQHEVARIGDRNDEEPVSDFLSWKTESLREFLADKYEFIRVSGSISVFDLDVIETAVCEK